MFITYAHSDLADGVAFKFMSASPFITGNQINQQKTLPADSNIQNRWHWRTNPPLRSTMWKNLPKVTNHKLDLNAFYAPEIIFIHIIAQKLQISLSKQKICGKFPMSNLIMIGLWRDKLQPRWSAPASISDFFEDKIT